MTIRHNKLLQAAINRSGKNIQMLDGKSKLSDCFTEYKGQLIFWYNDSTGSTQIVKERTDERD